ncbi:MAG: L-seryl-tRNA(Sec) selenium transferase [Acidimicrobiales bacterium]
MSHPPSVDRLARSQHASGLPHPLLVDVARARHRAAGEHRLLSNWCALRQRSMLMPVINATGVLLHTNLGRARLVASSRSPTALSSCRSTPGNEAAVKTSIGSTLAVATGAEAALVVNNGASAVLLVLAALATGTGVAVSRGELVEIGGGFRVPDVMQQSGARLVEVGTTNRTRLSDFARAIEHDGVTLTMAIHQSNYQIIGFTESTTVEELSTLGVPVIADIGSGLLDSATPWLDGPPPDWLANEPAAKQTLEAGANLVIFSGDKLFGSAQAGIIAGDADLIERCARHPLARAVRPGSLVMQAIQTTTLAYLRRDGNAIAFWRMASLTLDDLRRRAASYGRAAAVTETMAVPGGGTLPGVGIPSIGLALDGNHLGFLRSLDRPIVARIEDGRTILDLRTISPNDDAYVAAALNQLDSQ